MDIFNKLSGSADLVSGMAERLGVDLGAAIDQDPRLGAVRFRSLVLRCSSCTNQDGCAELQRGCDHLDAAPEYCRNKDFMDHAAHA